MASCNVLAWWVYCRRNSSCSSKVSSYCMHREKMKISTVWFENSIKRRYPIAIDNTELAFRCLHSCQSEWLYHKAAFFIHHTTVQKCSESLLASELCCCGGRRACGRGWEGRNENNKRSLARVGNDASKCDDEKQKEGMVGHQGTWLSIFCFVFIWVACGSCSVWLHMCWAQHKIVTGCNWAVL